MFYDTKTTFVIVFYKDKNNNYIQTIQHVFKDNLSINEMNGMNGTEWNEWN